MRQLFECGNYKIKYVFFQQTFAISVLQRFKNMFIKSKTYLLMTKHVDESPVCKEVQQSSDVSLDVSSSSSQRVGAVDGAAIIWMRQL